MIWNALLFSLALTGDFQQGNALYDAGKFADAAAVYAKCEPKTASVWFNLGNAQYRAGELGRAVVSYERARQLAPRDPDILANRKFAEEKLGVVEVNTPRHAWWLAVVEAQTFRQWCWWELVSVWAVIGLAGAAIWFVRWRTGLVIVTVVAGLGWGLATAALVTAAGQARTPLAVVVAAKAEARFAPVPEATVHFQLSEGTKVLISENRGAWVFVERMDAKQGWVRAETLELR